MGEGESKHDKFKRLATQRVANALKKIELIAPLIFFVKINLEAAGSIQSHQGRT